MYGNYFQLISVLLIFLSISDVPVQINHAKFEFNGMTGYLYKPWVMNREGAARGIFNPFVQSKLEDIVPAKLQVKVEFLFVPWGYVFKSVL